MAVCLPHLISRGWRQKYLLALRHCATSTSTLHGRDFHTCILRWRPNMSGQLPPGTDLAANSQPEIIGTLRSLLSTRQTLTSEGAVSATWALATIALFLRYFCRRISKAGLWWDDYLMIPGYIFTSIISWVTITYMMDHGFGKHIYIQPQERFLPTLMAFLKALFIAEVCYTGTIVFVKFSILAFYWRLFRLDNRVRYSVIALSVVVTMWGIAVVCYNCSSEAKSRS